MEIQGTTRVLGVIGNPVEHTLSPLIHNTLSEELGKDLIYVPLRVDQDVETAVRGAYALNFLGMNVTVPHKQAVIPALSSIDPLAQRIGAVNTLVREEKGFRGYNTDILGLKRALAKRGAALQGRGAALIGCGGAARAVAFLCADEQVSELTILNRTIEKAEALRGEVLKYYPDLKIGVLALSEAGNLPDGTDLAIQCTSAGMEKHLPDGSIVPGVSPVTAPAFYEKIRFAYDLVYRPSRTEFMQRVQEAGGEAYCGLDMLLYQGICAYELWNHLTVPEEISEKVLKKLEKAVQA
ncbi:MAG: shikimate dehydrogenase [Lachnospiraceae bacterium]|nr:shikimate dehydrogenase [Lachnospiraceae bacterium]